MKRADKKILEMVAMAEGLYRDAKDAFAPLIPELTENMAFFRGNQWGSSDELGQYDDAEASEEAREAYNYIRAFVRSAAAALLKTYPNPEVGAANDDTRSIARAMASHQLVRSFLGNGVVDYEELYRGVTAALVHGAMWFKCYWDPMGGEPVRTPRFTQDELGNEVPDYDEFGIQRFDMSFQGEITAEFVDVYDALPDPHARRPRELRHIFHRKLIPAGRLEDEFPEDAFGKPTKGLFVGQNKSDGQFERDASEGPRTAGGGYPPTKEPSNDLCELVEYWEYPSNQYRSGRLIVWCGDVVVAVGPLPNGRWPWVLFGGPNIIPNTLYSDGVVVDLKPAQRTLNLNASKMREWMEWLLSPSLLVPREADIEAGRFSDMAGEVILYNSGSKPEVQQVPAVPSSMFQHGETMIGHMKDIAGDSGISSGEIPQGLESGRALAFVHEFMEGRQAPENHRLRVFVTRVLAKCLELAHDHYEDGRLIYLMGEANQWLGKVFRAADFEFNVRLIIDPFSSQPQSRAVQRAEVMEAYQGGLFADTPEAKAARRMANFDIRDRSTIDPTEAHRKRALREQAYFITEGRPPEIREQDDDDVHLDEHNLYRVSEEYDDLDPQGRMLWDDHCAHHEEQRWQKMQVVAQEQGAMGGGGGLPAGGAPPPAEPGIESPMDGGHSLPGSEAPNETPEEVVQGTQADAAPAGVGAGTTA